MAKACRGGSNCHTGLKVPEQQEIRSQDRPRSTPNDNRREIFPGRTTRRTHALGAGGRREGDRASDLRTADAGGNSPATRRIPRCGG
jgi:hypothetical protein